MPRVIYMDDIVDFSNCDVILTNCKLRMKNCELIDQPVCADEQTSAIFEKMDRDQLRDENVKLREKNDKLSEEINQLRDENVKLREKNDKLSEESSDLTTDQSSETLVAVDSEETAKPCESREGSF